MKTSGGGPCDQVAGNGLCCSLRAGLLVAAALRKEEQPRLRGCASLTIGVDRQGPRRPVVPHARVRSFRELSVVRRPDQPRGRTLPPDDCGGGIPRGAYLRWPKADMPTACSS